ncbi:uncharacterized protein EV420DRAFT_1648617 [Desarmillaria tabescens]|uniref:F-box domain-containing protein n=1 Tax=Armillaria tabescens TaxID=1929756 RepID=A0AA39MSF1_ARMTA|nr:uncharacterized protein EV420DRAFT_1648617 [Desarmillaria tabescens]KAK0444917.1 hypothetical protein EV420DRAFT_1648617 [Desarmillaria tabescens]
MAIWTVGWKVPGLGSLTIAPEGPSFLGGHDTRGPLEKICLFSSFSNLRQLRKLNIEAYSVDLNFLVQLSSLPHLAELQVVITQTDKHQKRQAQIAFPSLKSLHINAHISLMPHILRLIRQGSLTSLTYRDTSDKDVTDLVGFVQAFHVEIAFRFPSLTSLILFHSQHRLADWKTLRAATEPLYDLSKLQKIIYHGTLCLDNDDIEHRFATSWPEIRLIHIMSLWETSLTYGILATLAKHCPHLTDLALPITFPEWDSPLRDGGVFSHRLRTFRAIGTRVHCYASVAHYLDRLFPFLVSVKGGEGWGQVESIILKACQPARRDQRLRG